MTNYERLTLEIVTDGAIDAKDAISKASATLKEHFNFFVAEEKEEKPKTKKAATKTAEEKEEKKTTKKAKEK